MSDVLEPARWPGGPKICPATNLPAFPTMKDLKRFFDGLPAVTVDRTGLCTVCQHYHAEAHHRDDSEAGLMSPETLAHGLQLSARDTERYRTL